MSEYLYWGIGIGGLLGLYMIDSRNKYAFFPGSLTYTRVLDTNLLGKRLRQSNEEDKLKRRKISQMCDNIKTWAIQNIQQSHMSHHWWYDTLPSDVKGWFDGCSKSSEIRTMLGTLFYPDEYIIEEVHEMNEVYVTGDERKHEALQSDRVFFISHIDGPFMWMPFVSVYRCLIGMNDNRKITTRFPMANYKKKIRKGDVLGFDFNREIHYITANKTECEEPRVTLKAHYCIYPKWAYYIGKLMYVCNARYNQLFRHLFLQTIDPSSWIDYFNGFVVVASTHCYVWLDMFVGYRNVYYIGFLYTLLAKGYLDTNLFSSALFFTSIYKSGATLTVSPNDPIEEWTFGRDLVLYYFLVFIFMFHNKALE